MVALASSTINLRSVVGSSLWRRHQERWIAPDEVGIAGLYWLTPYDMENNFGSAGQAVAAANERYLWLVSSDHFGDNDGDVSSDWTMGGGVWKGFSSDPAVLPTDWVQILPYSTQTSDRVNQHQQLETPWLVYNPDDATYPFYVYAHGNHSAGGHGQETLVFKSDDMETFTTPTVSHPTSYSNGHTGYQGVIRRAEDDWISMGLGRADNGDSQRGGFFSSTDGITFTKETPQNVTVEGEDFTWRGWTLTVDGQFYNTARRNTVPKDQAVMVPFNAETYQPTGDSVVPISPRYGGTFPELSYGQSVSGYGENGVYVYFVSRGYYANLGDAQLDLHTLIYDETAAASAAPFGVTAECVDGDVTISWLDALPHENYRVARSATGTGSWTNLSDVTGTSYTDAGATADALNYYRVTTLNGGEQGSRIVSVYAGDHAAIVNAHVTRALRAGASISNIDIPWVESVVSWLDSNSLTASLEHWVSPAFGVTYSSGTTVDYVFDLAKTFKPSRIDDTRANDTNWTYSATAVSGSVPGVEATGTTDGFAISYKKPNPLRLRDGTAATVLMGYNRDTGNSSTFHPFAWYNFRGLKFDHDVGNAKVVASQRNHSTATTWEAEIAVTNDADLVAGFTVNEGGGLTAWAQGSAGTTTQSDELELESQHMGSPRTTLHPAIGTDRFIYEEQTGGGDYTGSNGPGFSWSDCMIFNVALSSGQMSSLNTLLQNRYAA